MADKDALTLLKQDHEKVRKLLDELTRSKKAEKRTDLLQKIKMEIKIHSKIEEEIFYPAFQDQADTKEARVTVLESLEEHTMADRALADCEEVDASSEAFEGRARVLKELITHHADEEEKEMFAAARDKMKGKKLEALGREMEERKQELQQKFEKEQTV